MSAAARAACAFEGERRPRASRSFRCWKGGAWNRGRPRRYSSPCDCRRQAGCCQPSASYREAGRPALAAARCLVSVRDRRAAPRLLLCQLGPRCRQRGPGHLSWPRGGPWGRGRSTPPRLFSEKGTQAGALKPATVLVSLLSLLLGSWFCPSLSSMDLQTPHS